jgi:hypothetical protein
MNTNIKDSIYISDSRLDNTKIINVAKEKRKSFWNGFFIGIISSVIGGAIWYLVQTYLIN